MQYLLIQGGFESDRAESFWRRATKASVSTGDSNPQQDGLDRMEQRSAMIRHRI